MHTTDRGRMHNIYLPFTAFIILVGASFAHAGTIQSLTGNITASPLFDGNTDQWMISYAGLTNGTVTDGTGYPNIWFIDDNVNFTWTGNTLNTDLNPNDPTQPADALFNGGGTLTITGKLYDAMYNVLFDGLLLEGSVSGYRMTETAADTNNINLVENTAYVTIEDGFLMDNTQGVMNMPAGSKYWLDTSFGKVEQDGGDLMNWQGGYYASGTSTGLSLAYWVPEPSTGLLLLGGISGLIALRRRNSIS